MTTKEKLLASTANSNSGGLTAFGIDMLNQAELPAKLKTGALSHAVTHANVIISLLPKLAVKDVNVRDTLLTFWRENTPAGAKFYKAFNALKDEEDRTPEQNGAFAKMQGVLKALNKSMVDAIDTYKGMEILRKSGRKVSIRKVPGMDNVFNCFVIYPNNPALKDNEQEEYPTEFNVTALQNVNHIANKIKPDMQTTTLRKLAAKYTPPNNQPGGAVEVDRSKLPELVKVLDTALVGTVKEGKIEGVTSECRDTMLQIWARLDLELSTEEKQKARAAFAKLAAPIADKVPNVVEKVKAEVKKTA